MGESWEPSSQKILPINWVQSQPRENQINSIKVLIINDHTLLREGIASVLNQFAKIELIGSTASMTECLNLVESMTPDIIISDLENEAPPPQALIEQVKEIDENVNLIFLANHKISYTQLLIALDQGVQGIISKEESGRTIFEALTAIKSGNNYYSEDLRKRIFDHTGLEPETYISKPRKNILSPREIEVLLCVAKGMKAKTIGKHLHITSKTVERHKSNIMGKLNLHSQVDLTIYAIKEGHITL